VARGLPVRRQALPRGRRRHSAASGRPRGRRRHPAASGRPRGRRRRERRAPARDARASPGDPVRRGRRSCRALAGPAHGELGGRAAGPAHGELGGARRGRRAAELGGSCCETPNMQGKRSAACPQPCGKPSIVRPAPVAGWQHGLTTTRGTARPGLQRRRDRAPRQNRPAASPPQGRLRRRAPAALDARRRTRGRPRRSPTRSPPDSRAAPAPRPRPRRRTRPRPRRLAHSPYVLAMMSRWISLVPP